MDSYLVVIVTATERRPGRMGSVRVVARDDAKEMRDGVAMSNLDQPLFEGSEATKRDLVDYLDGVSDQLVPCLRGRALSVIRVHRGDAPFMQKNLPKYTPDWVRSVTMWAESSKRDVTYAVCDDRRTLLWFGNQRAVEFHPSLTTVDHPDRVSFMVLDLDPPEGTSFSTVVATAELVRSVLDDVGLQGAVKTSGAKGVHIFVPLDETVSMEDAALATRAIAERAAARDPKLATTAFMKEDRGGLVFVDSTRGGGATVVSAYSPRVRPGVPVSFPVGWDDLRDVVPSDITIFNALDRLGGTDPWAATMPAPQSVPADLVDEGREHPVPRVAAMHEGKRRRRAAGS